MHVAPIYIMFERNIMLLIKMLNNAIHVIKTNDKVLCDILPK